MFYLVWKEKRALVRVYGHSSSYINRETEISFMKQMEGKLAFISRLYGTFRNGFCYQYFPGKTVKNDELTDSELELIAKQISLLNQQTPSFQETRSIWDFIRILLGRIEEKDLEGTGTTKKNLEEGLTHLQEFIHKEYSSDIVLSHNDVHAGNIVKDGFF